MADPCLHERDWIRMEQTVERHEKELRDMNTSAAETKVYMKQVLESQSDMKKSVKESQDKMENSLKEIQDKLNAPPPVPPPTPISQDTQMSLLQRMLPQLLDLLKWAVIIIGALVGVESLLK